MEELTVTCPYLDAGCKYIGERHLLESHLKQQCPYAQVPCLCFDKSCKRTVARRDALDGRTVVHQESDPEVLCCRRFPFQGGLTCTYLSQPDDARTVTCESCGKEFSHVSAVESHLANSCLEKIVSCDQAENGCTWKGRRLSLKVHAQGCSYESIKGFFVIHNTGMAQLSKDNERLRRRTEELEGVVRILKQELEWAKLALGPWYRPVYTERFPLTANYVHCPNDGGASAGPGPSRVQSMLLRGTDPVTGGTPHPEIRAENDATDAFDFFDPFSLVGRTRNHEPNIHAANNVSSAMVATNTEPNPSTHTRSDAAESGDSQDSSGYTISGSGSETIQNAIESALSPGTNNFQSTSTTPPPALFSDHFPSENEAALEEGGSPSRPQGWQHVPLPNSMPSNANPGIHLPVSNSRPCNSRMDGLS